MIDSKVEVYKYKPIVDGYGGSNLVPVKSNELLGKFIPKVMNEDVTGAKKGFKIQAKLICDKRFNPADGQLIKYDGIMYSIVGIKDIHSKGSVLELVVNG